MQIQLPGFCPRFEERRMRPMKNVELSMSDAQKTMFKDYPDVVNVKQLREMLGGIGQRAAYRLVTSRTIPSVKSGKGYKIPKVFVIKYLLSI